MTAPVDPYSHRTEVRWAHSWRRVVGVTVLVLLGGTSMVVGGWLGVLQMRVAAQRDLVLRAAEGAARSLAEAEAALESAEEASRVALERESVGRTPIADPRVHRIAEQAAENVRRTILDAANGRVTVPGDAVWAAQCVSGASDLAALSCATSRGTVSGYDAAATLYRLGGHEDVLQRVERAALLTALADSGHTELAVGLRQAWERLGRDPNVSLLSPEVLTAAGTVSTRSPEARALERLVADRRREVRSLRSAARIAGTEARAPAALPVAHPIWAWLPLGVGLLALALAGVLVRRRRGIVVVDQDGVRIDGRRVARADLVGVELDRGRLRIALHGGRTELLDGDGDLEAVAESLRRLLPTRDERRAEARGRVQAAVFQQAVEARSASE